VEIAWDRSGIRQRLNKDFYLSDDVVGLARELLGKALCVDLGEGLCAGLITETEAYAGATDRASHAYGGRRTERTRVMYSAGGVAYIYLCYGMHSLFNVVTGSEGTPHAVLVRGIWPLEGLGLMQQRLGRSRVEAAHTRGPGKLSKALGIHHSMTGTDLLGNRIWIADVRVRPPDKSVRVTTRIGIDYAGDDAGRPYRFVWDTEDQRSFLG